MSSQRLAMARSSGESRVRGAAAVSSPQFEEHSTKRGGPRADSLDRADHTSWFDLPLVLALFPAVGSLLTGSDLLKDLLHLAFLLYYLHNLIKVPWTLYVSARARRAQTHYAPVADDQAQELARTELRLAELIYLAFTVITPFLGAVLLRSISQLLSIDTVSPFSTSLFVLATGIRPWRHLVHILKQRTEALHDIVHLPPTESVHSRLDRLEEEISELRSLLATKADGQSVLDVAGTSLETARKEIKQSERQSELARANVEARLTTIELSMGTFALPGMAPSRTTTKATDHPIRFATSMIGYALGWTLGFTPSARSNRVPDPPLRSRIVEVEDHDSGVPPGRRADFAPGNLKVQGQHPSPHSWVNKNWGQLLIRMTVLPLQFVRDGAYLALEFLHK